ncbi:MAG: hypothetical protein JRJ51_15265 [Deltaproteobacteria bacterium]|nr:hypothetical protein [Deltaproteobacteria bacterium]
MSASDDLHTKILSHGPSSETLFILLSQMKEEGKSGKVIQTCVRALDIYPGAISIRKLLAETFLEAGFISQAETEMEKVSREIKDLATIYKRKAEILAKQQRSEEAIEAARTYLAHYPDDLDAIRLLEGLTPPEEVPVQDIPEETEEAPVEATQVEPIPETYPEPPEEMETPPEPEMDAAEAPAPEPEDEGNKVKEKTEKMINTLESWLEEIREIAKPPIS